MTKLFIEAHLCKHEHLIFTGKNALMQALFYNQYGRLATPDQLFGLKFNLQQASSWGVANGNKSQNHVSGVSVIGDGVHAKMYIVEGATILSSQNNCTSPLFEFAILYQHTKKNSKLKDFVMDSIQRAKSYSEWWRVNKKFGIRGTA